MQQLYAIIFSSLIISIAHGVDQIDVNRALKIEDLKDDGFDGQVSHVESENFQTSEYVVNNVENENFDPTESEELKQKLEHQKNHFEKTIEQLNEKHEEQNQNFHAHLKSQLEKIKIDQKNVLEENQEMKIQKKILEQDKLDLLNQIKELQKLIPQNENDIAFTQTLEEKQDLLSQIREVEKECDNINQMLKKKNQDLQNQNTKLKSDINKLIQLKEQDDAILHTKLEQLAKEKEELLTQMKDLEKWNEEKDAIAELSQNENKILKEDMENKITGVQEMRRLEKQFYEDKISSIENENDLFMKEISEF